MQTERWTDRTQILLGEEGLDRLRGKRVTVFGVGGVGGAAVEALVRTGVGRIRIVDGDVVAPSNLNRQLIATVDTLGRSKVEVARERLLQINPELEIEAHHCFFLPENGTALIEGSDYVVDCIDTVTAKLFLIEKAVSLGIPVISSMGAGNRYDPSKLELTDLAKTEGCALARVMRRELRKRGITHLPVVFSREEGRRPFASEVFPEEATGEKKGKLSPGSMMFVPVTAGLLLASRVIRDLLGGWPS